MLKKVTAPLQMRSLNLTGQRWTGQNYSMFGHGVNKQSLFEEKPVYEQHLDTLFSTIDADKKSKAYFNYLLYQNRATIRQILNHQFINKVANHQLSNREAQYYLLNDFCYLRQLKLLLTEANGQQLFIKYEQEFAYLLSRIDAEQNRIQQLNLGEVINWNQLSITNPAINLYIDHLRTCVAHTPAHAITSVLPCFLIYKIVAAHIHHQVEPLNGKPSSYFNAPTHAASNLTYNGNFYETCIKQNNNLIESNSLKNALTVFSKELTQSPYLPGVEGVFAQSLNYELKIIENISNPSLFRWH